MSTPHDGNPADSADRTAATSPSEPAAEDSSTGTEAVLFDPFADDDDPVTAPTGIETKDPDNLAALLEDLEKLRDQSLQETAQNDLAGQEDTSTRARRAALDIFRKRRRHRRQGRFVADGMVNLPYLVPKEPEDALIDAAKVAQDKHISPPQLAQGDVVAGQYEIMGVLAHGGMGWIYLAEDKFVSNRVVVLKGMQAQTNKDEQAAAEAEREFLADITHPGIVKIFNFIDDPRVPGGFIVMEYVGGPSLRHRRNGEANRLLPIDIAIGYILEILPALDYLHSRGVVYNDLKPDNIIVTEDQVKLIDLGAVSGIDAFGFIYGTRGYQAPEVSSDGPSVASDIYTVGRTLAALTLRLPTVDGAYAPGLPSPSQEPDLRRHLSFYRLLLRCTHPERDKRFKSVAELRTQLYGVLREVIAERDGRQFPAQHSLFSPQRTTFGTKHLVFRTDQLIDGIHRTVRITAPEVVSALPIPLLDHDDVGAPLMQGASYAEPQEALETFRQAMTTPKYAESAEIPFGVVRTMLDLGYTGQAREWLDSLTTKLGNDWRYHWYSGLAELMRDNYAQAQKDFAETLSLLPGEPAPKLALAAVNELLLQQLSLNEAELVSIRLARATSGLAENLTDLDNSDFDDDEAFWNHVTTDPKRLRFNSMRLYGLVWLANPSTVSSAFGLARQLRAEQQLELAVMTLDKVPNASRHYRMARLTSILQLISQDLTESRIRRAARRLEEIPTNEPRFLQIKIAVLSAGLNFLRDASVDAAASPNDLFEYAFTQDGIRFGLADTLRTLARQAPFSRHRYELVDLANKVRPVTLY